MALLSSMAKLNMHVHQPLGTYCTVLKFVIGLYHRQETSLHSVYNPHVIRGIGGPLVAKGDHLQQLYLASRISCGARGTTCSMTGPPPGAPSKVRPRANCPSSSPPLPPTVSGPGFGFSHIFYSLIFIHRVLPILWNGTVQDHSGKYHTTIFTGRDKIFTVLLAMNFAWLLATLDHQS